MGYDLKLRVWRGDQDGGDLADYTVEVSEGEVVLDALHRLQATQTGDLAIDLRNMLIVSEAIAKAALAREESRGGHTRDDFPKTDHEVWGKKNLVVTLNAAGDGVDLAEKPLPVMPDELKKYFE